MIFHVSCSSTARTCSFTGEWSVCPSILEWISRCLSDLRGIWALSTPRERPSIQANAIRENRWALFYEGEWDSAINNWAPEVPLYRPDPFCPPGSAQFLIIFSWESQPFFDPDKKYLNLSPWARLNFTVPLKITTDPVGILRSKNNQKKINYWSLFGHFLVPKNYMKCLPVTSTDFHNASQNHCWPCSTFDV